MNTAFAGATYAPLVLWFTGGRVLSRILEPLVFFVAGIYFLVDAAFWALSRPIVRWLADRRLFDRLRNWVVSLGPYSTLALFVVPVLVLEPAKPVAAYLTTTGRMASGLIVLGVSELLKLVLIERLFSISRDKLMSIPAFACCYGKFEQVRRWVESLRAWQLARYITLIDRSAILRYVIELKSSRKREQASWQLR